MKFYERVISDFGGYGKCKDILSQPNIDFIMNAQGLREHMLKYRRQHNIFEVGDKVLRNDMEQDAIFTIVEKSTLNDREIIYCSINDVDYCFYSDILRHATPEEIKAGRRL